MDVFKSVLQGTKYPSVPQWEKELGALNNQLLWPYWLITGLVNLSVHYFSYPVSRLDNRLGAALGRRAPIWSKRLRSTDDRCADLDWSRQGSTPPAVQPLRVWPTASVGDQEHFSQDCLAQEDVNPRVQNLIPCGHAHCEKHPGVGALVLITDAQNDDIDLRARVSSISGRSSHHQHHSAVTGPFP